MFKHVTPYAKNRVSVSRTDFRLWEFELIPWTELDIAENYSLASCLLGVDSPVPRLTYSAISGVSWRDRSRDLALHHQCLEAVTTSLHRPDDER
jgi:hypothetical protein